MAYQVAVADSVFPNLDPAKAVVSRIGATLQLAPEPTAEAIMKIAKDADAILVTYAKITGDMIRQLTKCRIISRFGIGVDNVDIPEATKKNIVVTKVPDYCIDEVSDHTMALLRSEEHTSELQSRLHLVCRLLLEKKNVVRSFYATDHFFRTLLMPTCTSAIKAPRDLS